MFAYAREEMPRIDVEITVHKLTINPQEKLVKWKISHTTSNRNQPRTEEVQKFLDIGFIKEYFYLNWMQI